MKKVWVVLMLVCGGTVLLELLGILPMGIKNQAVVAPEKASTPCIGSCAYYAPNLKPETPKDSKTAIIR